MELHLQTVNPKETQSPNLRKAPPQPPALVPKPAVARRLLVHSQGQPPLALDRAQDLAQDLDLAQGQVQAVGAVTVVTLTL